MATKQAQSKKLLKQLEQLRRVGIVPKNGKLELRFSPFAWEKLESTNKLCDSTEVGGFGISRKNDLLSVEDFALIKQEVTSVRNEFDDISVADYFEDQVDAGRRPEQFGRIWVHTHPNFSKEHKPLESHRGVISFLGNIFCLGRRDMEDFIYVPRPSPPDEECFGRAFGNCNWSIMFITLGTIEGSYCRLSLNTKPRINMLLDVVLDESKNGDRKVTNKLRAEWEQEFIDKVIKKPIPAGLVGLGQRGVVDLTDYSFDDALIGAAQAAIVDTDIDPDAFTVYIAKHGITDMSNLTPYDLQWWQRQYRNDQRSNFPDIPF